jgi:uncharacterized protein (DUF2141 family)
VRPLLFALLLTTLTVAALADPRKACLVVHVDGLKVDGRDLRVAVFNQPRGFPFDSASADTGLRAVVNAESLVLTFCNLPFGRYAVAMHHDQNGNHIMDMNFLGIPREGYGLSKNVHPRVRPPSFAACAVPAAQDTVQITVHMHY